MPSPANDVATQAFFRQKKFFGLAPKDVFFLVQGTMPAFDFDGKILLTELGRGRAESVYKTHMVIFRFLREVLGVDAKTADAEACKMEHGLSERTRARLVQFLNEQCAPGAVRAAREPEAGE